MKIIESNPRVPVLSSRDLDALIPKLQDAIQDSRVERIFVPSAPLHPDGFPKRTFVLELHRKSLSLQLYVSLRPGECGLVVLPAKSMKPAASAPRSGFELALAKHLPGTKITGLRQIPGDRIDVLSFQSHSLFTVCLHLIPGKPVGVFRTGPLHQILHATDSRMDHPFPEGRNLNKGELEKIPVHPDWTSSAESYAKLWSTAERASFLRLRLMNAGKKLSHDLQAIEQKIRSLDTQLENTRTEEDWARFGDLLRIHLHERPQATGGVYVLTDPETGIAVRIPANPKLRAEEQLERYFHQAKRKKKRLSETQERLLELRKKASHLETLRAILERAETPEDVMALETSLGLERNQSPSTPRPSDRRIAEFTGRVYRSKEGLLILAGRNKVENLMLTFKIAKGNDLWLHVRGRPGSHTVILLPPKRTASLETLLDAAHLCILHSGGRQWGKTEVDYTPRKFVKRIRDQSEVSYTGNKTLSIVLEESRIKRLQDSIEG